MHLSPLILYLPAFALAAPSAQRIAELFAPLANGDGASLTKLFSPDLVWTTMGGFVGASRNYSETLEFFANVTNAIRGEVYKVETTYVISEGAGGDYSSTELKAADGTVGKNGVPYSQQRYVWVTKWDGEKIVQTREYLDSELADRLLGLIDISPSIYLNGGLSDFDFSTSSWQHPLENDLVPESTSLVQK